MKRRSFLKLLGLPAAIALYPPLALSNSSDVDGKISGRWDTKYQISCWIKQEGFNNDEWIYITKYANAENLQNGIEIVDGVKFSINFDNKSKTFKLNEGFDSDCTFIRTKRAVNDIQIQYLQIEEGSFPTPFEIRKT